MRKKAMKKTTRSRKKKLTGRYKSGLEKYCADKLAEYGIAFDYEERVYLLQDSFRYNGVYHKMTARGKNMIDRSNSVVLPIRYTPDFTGRDYDWIIETKGFTFSQHTFQLRWKLFLQHVNRLDNPPAVFMPKNKEQVDKTVEMISQLIKNGQIQTI